MTKLNFRKTTRVQVNKTIGIVADCLATVRIHDKERERGGGGMKFIGTYVIACKFIERTIFISFRLFRGMYKILFTQISHL